MFLRTVEWRRCGRPVWATPVVPSKVGLGGPGVRRVQIPEEEVLGALLMHPRDEPQGVGTWEQLFTGPAQIVLQEASAEVLIDPAPEHLPLLWYVCIHPKGTIIVYSIQASVFHISIEPPTQQNCQTYTQNIPAESSRTSPTHPFPFKRPSLPQLTSDTEGRSYRSPRSQGPWARGQRPDHSPSMEARCEREAVVFGGDGTGDACFFFLFSFFLLLLMLLLFFFFFFWGDVLI